MRVFGIDPGTHRIGWGVIQGNILKQESLGFGCIDLPKHTSSDQYLQQIHQDITSLLDTHKPEIVGVERLFFQKNRKTASQVTQARGVILLAIAEQGLPVVELSPNTIKSAVAGSGKATKKQLAQMVTLLLELDETPALDDTTDALAVAITTLITKGKI